MQSRRLVVTLRQWPPSPDHLPYGRVWVCRSGREGSQWANQSVTRSDEEGRHLVPPDRIVRAEFGVRRRVAALSDSGGAQTVDRMKAAHPA
jgi:hypothetical protein